MRLGYGITSFEIAVPANLNGMVTVPDVGYKYLELAPYIRIPFEVAGSWWELGGGFSYMLVSDGGQITTGGRNNSIGRLGASVGIGGNLSLNWAFKPWLNLGLLARVARFSTEFARGGM